jgi:hypothetical protein
VRHIARNSTRHTPQLRISTTEIRNHIITAQSTVCDNCGAHAAILTGDIALLLAEITRLYQSLIRARRQAANYEAAIHAAIGAQEDGDHDPIGYLRDELTPSSGGAYGA